MKHFFSSRKPSNLWKQFLALLGLLLITFSILLFDEHLIPPFPNCYTLVPTFGTALIIIYGNHQTLVGCLLSTRPLRWIGLISYSAYLWHQPLLVYLRLQSIELQNISYISLIVVAFFLLATLTYIFVEQPFRNRTLFSRIHIFCISLAGALIMFLVALFLIRTANNRSLTGSKVMNNQSLEIVDKTDTYLLDIEPIELSNYVTRRFDQHMRKYPTFSNQSASTNRRILLIGDSFAQDFMNMVAETRSLVDYEIRCHYVKFYCQIYMGPEDRLQWIAPGHKGYCINDNDIRLALPLIRQANIIILASNWREWSAKRLPKTIELLNLTQSQKVFVLGVKNFGTVNLTLYMNKSFEYRIQQFQQPEDDAMIVNTIMKQTLNRSIFVNIMSMTCTHYNGTCPVFTTHGKLISYDGAHTTKHGARFVGDIIFKKFPLNQI